MCRKRQTHIFSLYIINDHVSCVCYTRALSGLMFLLHWPISNEWVSVTRVLFLFTLTLRYWIYLLLNTGPRWHHGANSIYSQSSTTSITCKYVYFYLFIFLNKYCILCFITMYVLDMYCSWSTPDTLSPSSCDLCSTQGQLWEVLYLSHTWKEEPLTVRHHELSGHTLTHIHSNMEEHTLEQA